jgi:hypothetical protein
MEASLNRLRRLRSLPLGGGLALLVASAAFGCSSSGNQATAGSGAGTGGGGVGGAGGANTTSTATMSGGGGHAGHSATSSTTGGKGGHGGEGGQGEGGKGGEAGAAGAPGTGGGKAISPYKLQGSDLVSNGTLGTSTSYQLIDTTGQSTTNQVTFTSTTYVLQGGLIGTIGSTP